MNMLLIFAIAKGKNAMYTALDQNGNAVYIDYIDYWDKSKQYYCPACKNQLVVKCGSIVSHHFAHKSSKDCDTWYTTHSMSKWHKAMQAKFRPDQQERVIWNADRSQYRIADVVVNRAITPIVFEFQHSNIRVNEFIERSKFYLDAGYSLAWIFNYRDYDKKPAKTIFYTEEYDRPRDCNIRRFYWPGNDRVRLFDSPDVQSFFETYACNNSFARNPLHKNSLSVYFYIKTGWGVCREHEYEGSLYLHSKWEYLNPLDRETIYVQPAFNDDGISYFTGRFWGTSEFESAKLYLGK